VLTAAIARRRPGWPQEPVSGPELHRFRAHPRRPLALAGGELPEVFLLGVAAVAEATVAPL
jgi:hypothetical protein